MMPPRPYGRTTLDEPISTYKVQLRPLPGGGWMARLWETPAGCGSAGFAGTEDKHPMVHGEWVCRKVPGHGFSER